MKRQIKYKKVHPGRYEAKAGNVSIEIYRAEGRKYWGCTIEVGTYGDDDWTEEIFHANTKRDIIVSVQNWINRR